MPLSNVFRHSFPNPFHSPSRKSRHAHAHPGSTTGSSTSIVVVPVVEGNTSKSNTNKSFFPTFGRSDSRKSLSWRDEGKKDDGKKRRKGSQATSKSTHSSLSACHLERLDADTLPRPSSPSDVISQLQISKAPPSQEQHMSALSSPTSTSFSPSPLSPQIRMPTSPSAPSTPSVNTSARLFSASPEPLSPTPTSPVSLTTTGTIGSRFGSLFSNKSTRRDMEGRILSEQSAFATKGKENVDPATAMKKKRLSTGSLQIPIGAFLTNSFRNMQQQGALQKQQQQSSQQLLPSVQEQENDQTQQPPQRKKRRGLLPKLPKLDTRPRIIISRSGTKKQKEAKQTAAMGHGDETQAPPELSTVNSVAAPGPGSDVVPGSTATATRRPGGSKSSSLKASPKLLSPFYLPPQIRTGAGSHSTQYLDPNVRLPPPMMTTTTGEKNAFPTATSATGSQAGQQLLDVSFNPTSEWHRDSQVFYDDRWDRASVRTVDTEIIRLSDDPNFPGYPERNDYWQQHCRIRERRWKHQIQKHQQQQIMDARSPKKWLNGVKANPVIGLAEEDTGSLLEEDDEDDDDNGPLADRLRDVTNLLNSLPETTARRTRLSTAPQSSHQNRFRQRRERYTTYSAYIAAMQVKSKNRTDHKRSFDVAAMASPNGSDTNKLMADVRALRERSMTQPTNVKDTADKFGGTVMEETDWLHGQRRHTHRREGTNLGSSDDEGEDQYEAEDRVHPMSSFNTLHRQRQPDSGILFVAAAATTAEVYPTLVHDPREQQQHLRNKSSAAKTKMDHHHFHSKHTRSPDGLSGPEMNDATAKIGNNSNLSNDKNTDDNINKNNNDDNNSSNNDYNNNNNINKKKDLCLSRPGQYASHNHIMPLEQLLELEEQGRQRRRQLQLQQQELDRQQKLMMMEQQQQQQQLQVSIYPDPTTKPSAITTSLPSSTASASQSTPSSLLPSSLLPSAPTTPSSSSPSSPRPTVGGAGNSRGNTFLTDLSTATSAPSPSSSFSSTPTPLVQQPATDLEPTSPTQTQQPRRQSSGYMLLVLDQGRCQYYENGTRKRGPQWDYNEEQGMPEGTTNSYNDGGGGHDATAVIEEEVEEVDEVELAWMAQQKQRQEFNPDLKRKSGGREASRVHLFDEQLDEEQQGPSQEVDPLGSLAVIDSPLSPRFAAVLSESPTVTAKSSQVFSAHPSRSSTPNSANALEPRPQPIVVASSTSSSTNVNQPARLASSNGLSTLSRIRAVKSRASLSYSVQPTLSTSSYASSNVLTAAPGSSSASTSTSTLLSSAPSTLLNNPSLKHEASGSMTPGSTLYSGGGGTTPATSSSPLATTTSVVTSSSSMFFPGRKLSWSGLPSKPTSSASALLLDALLKPATASTTLQDGASTTTIKSLTRSTTTKNDPAQRLKQQWGQKMRSQSVMFMSPSAMAARSRSMLHSPPAMAVSGSKLWMRNSVNLLAPLPAEGTDKNWRQQDQRQRRQGAMSESYLDSQHIEIEADQEMEEELLRQLLDDATTDDPQYQHPNKNKHKKNRSGGSGSSGRGGLGSLLGGPSVGVEARKARRALSMVELSASTSASQYKAALVLPAGRTRERYKAEASISFSTMATLASEGMYQWSEFFDV